MLSGAELCERRKVQPAVRPRDHARRYLAVPSDDPGSPGDSVPGRADSPAEPGLEAAARAGQGSQAASPLVLELVITGTEPLSGTVGPAGSQWRLAFHGWIDLMIAIGTLHAGPAG